MRTIARGLLIIFLLLLYLAASLLLLIESFSLPWVLIFITLHGLYSWSLIWFYAWLKVQNQKWALILLAPVLTTTSTLGIALWLGLQPERRIRASGSA